MKILKMAIGNREEAYIEQSFSGGLNVIYSDENNKGKTIVVQSMMYALGNRPIFPDSFNYKDYFHYIEIEHEGRQYAIARIGDSFIVRCDREIRIFDGISEFKRYWNTSIFPLPQIVMNGSKKIVDMELFIQLFFVGQDGKDTSTIFNQGYYHKEDFKNMVLSYAGNFDSELSDDEIRRIKARIGQLSAQRGEKLKLSEFYQSSSSATEYLSRIKDRDAFQARVSEMESIGEKIAEVRKRRSRIASQKSLWNGTLKELRSLNRNIEVGELRCMDCNSANIAYKGTGKVTYSFDVSTPEMRDQIIASIEDRISAYDEEIHRCDFEICELQKSLQGLMDDEEVTIENVVAYKQGFRSVEEIEAAVAQLELEIKEYQDRLATGLQETETANTERSQFYAALIESFNDARAAIDPEGDVPYTDLFTKRGTVASGSEETVFYVSRLLALADKTEHLCPIIMDSFRAEDLSTEKEERVLKLLLSTGKQCILTTTLKAEEHGKYCVMEGVTAIDYTSHRSNKLLSPEYLPEFRTILDRLRIQM